MTYQLSAISKILSSLTKVSAWITSQHAETTESVALRSGTALTVINHLMTKPTCGVLVQLLANRLAWIVAPATSKVKGD